MSISTVYSDGNFEWDLPRLWELSRVLMIEEVDPEAFHEWEDGGWRDMTLGEIAVHMRRVMESDLSYPVIVSAEGNIMDGNHRVIKAWLEGKMVKMVRFSKTPIPDRIVSLEHPVVVNW